MLLELDALNFICSLKICSFCCLMRVSFQNCRPPGGRRSWQGGRLGEDRMSHFAHIVCNSNPCKTRVQTGDQLRNVQGWLQLNLKIKSLGGIVVSSDILGVSEPVFQ